MKPLAPRRRRSVIPWFISLLIALPMPAAIASTSFDDLRWQNRGLLVFAPAPDDPRMASMLQATAARECEMTDRDLLVIPVLTEDAPGLAQGEAARLRQRHVVGSHDFAVILIGKDGGAKMRSAEIPELDRVFALIDGMPMRRAEMRSRGVPPCGSPSPAPTVSG